MAKIFTKKKEQSQVVNIAVIIFVIVAIIYGIITIVKNSMERPMPYTSNNIKEYIKEENLLKSDYFYTLDAEVANFLEAVDKEMYFELYQILINNYNKIYSKSELTEILKGYKENIFIYKSTNENTKYNGHVVNVYTLDNSRYLVQLDFDNNNFYLVFGTGLNKYNFTIVE